MSNTPKPCFKTSVGGQALLEGVMMKGPSRWAMAVRRPDGTITVEGEALKQTPSWQKLPVVRGVFTFAASLMLGYSCLMRSADLSMDEGEEAPGKAPSSRPVNGAQKEEAAGAPVPQENRAPAQTAPPPETEKSAPFAGAAGLLTAVAGVGLALGLFLVLPTALVGLLAPFVELGGWRTPLEGALKLLIFIAYVAACSLQKDVYRMFSYHGAEHKTIACYEAGEALTVENVRRHTRFHPRCGTSFLLVVMVVSILLFSFIPWHSTLGRVGLKLLLLPAVMGLSYEIIRFTGRHDGAFSRAVAAPGLWMQRLTTHEPDDGMIEVAIAAVTPVLPQNPGDAPW